VSVSEQERKSVCVCVCVCARERVREAVGASHLISLFHSPPLTWHFSPFQTLNAQRSTQKRWQVYEKKWGISTDAPDA
jgi:hypothetical protein